MDHRVAIAPSREYHCTHPLRSRGIKAKERMFVWLWNSSRYGCKMRLPLCLHKWKFWQWQLKSNFKQNLTSFYCAVFFNLASYCYRAVEPIYKIISKFLDYDESCTNKGIRRKNLGTEQVSLDVRMQTVMRPSAVCPSNEYCLMAWLGRTSRL